MTRTKLGLMGLCAVVIGMMAMSASSAQAAFSWLVLDEDGTALEISGNPANLLVPLVGEKDSSHIVLLSSPGVMVSVVCTNFTLEEIHLAAAGALTHGKVKFTGCEVRAGNFNLPLSNVLNTTKLPCTVSAGGGPAGTVITEKGEGQLVLHKLSGGGTEVLTLLAPLAPSTTFVTLLFGGPECTLPEEDPVTGELFLKDCEGKATVHLVRHLVEEGPLSSLLLGGIPATLLGSGWITLGGDHVGLAWAAMDA